MKFDLFDKQMRKHEESLDQFIPTDSFMVARLDGKGFTRLTKEELPLEKPFDARFKEAVLNTMHYLMSSDFQIAYAYAQSDEISLLFYKNADKYKRKVRKYNSILAAETSVKFSEEIGRRAIFDCRLIPLPTLEDVLDYFAWRQADSHRNAIHAYCYYKLISLGKTPRQAADELKRKIFTEKIKLLTAYGIDLNHLPRWQLYGYSIRQSHILKTGLNPVAQTEETVVRSQLITLCDLPSGPDYRKKLLTWIEPENPI